ncbi:MAG: transglycosylase SLT domain-containing protein [Deltaproteobacteria bacterium]|nr:transglycosylase SLT domain-containing protein [Deltaproteobacteria bacterium]
MKSKHTRVSRVVSVLVFLSLALVRDARAGNPPPLRFSPEFPVSQVMEARVRFWIRVFTEVSQNEAVLHDRDDLRVVYDVVPYDTERSIEPVRASYARLLASLAVAELFPLGGRDAIAPFTPPSPERQRLHALFESVAAARPIGYARATANIRAQRGLKEIFADSLTRAELYLPEIRRIFAAAALPAELVYLPHVESSFNPNAVSRASAAGLWQFTKETAGGRLRMTAGVDERFDPVRSSEAAAEHLARARSVLGSWPLAVSSYNHGVAGIARARVAVGSDSLDDIIRGYDGASFGFASRNFYAEFLAAAHVAQHADYYFPELKRTPVLQYVVRRGDSLWTIARKHRVSVRALVAANNLGRSPLQQGQRLMIRL